MPKKLEIRDSEKIRSEIQKFFSSDEDARFVRRLDTILLICNGYSIRQTSEIFNTNPTTIQRWIQKLNKQGFQGLKDQEGRGRRSQLSNDDLSSLKADLKLNPGHFGYENARWDGKLLSHHLRIHYRAELKVRRCQYLFKELGYSLQRPRKMPAGGDPKNKEAFKKNSK